MLILYLILGLKTTWQPESCDRVFATESNKTYCEQQQVLGYERACLYAEWMAEEAERWDLPPELLPVVAYREQSLDGGDRCVVTLDASRLISRDLEDEDSNRWRLCWRVGEGRTCQPALLVSEDEENGTLRVDRCAHGEFGLFQLMMREVPANYDLPWGESTGRSSRERRAIGVEDRANIHFGARALAENRERCCGEDQECRADWTRWIGGHNTGLCRGTAFDRYAAKLKTHLNEALAYACAHIDHPLCPHE
jgi:hypothetical protein